MEEITDPFTPEERQALERKGRRIFWWILAVTLALMGGCTAAAVAAGSDGQAETRRYNECSDLVRQRIPDAATYEPSRLNLVGRCMEAVEGLDH